MITKLAIFEGTLKPGAEAEMRAYVEDTLAPLWRNFTGANRVRVLFAEKQDAAAVEESRSIPLILEVDYLTQADLDQAMASPARYKSRDLLPGFYERFFEDVRLKHFEFSYQKFPTKSSNEERQKCESTTKKWNASD